MRSISFLLLTFLILDGNSQNPQTLIYSEDPSNIANPERGFYAHTEAHSDNYSLLNASSLLTLRESRSITQILRVFYLEDFRNKPIDQNYLNNIRSDFATVRSAGLKMIVRFAYSQGTTAPYDDATPEVVLNHIGQLTPIFQENGDVIVTVQTGFIGTWGEWFYTDHFAQMPGNISEEDWTNRKRVTQALLEALPNNRTIQLRTPRYKTRMFETEEPIGDEIGFTNTDLARIGHHNDCFVASSNDLGTYLDQEKEKTYLASETMYVPMGGETCGLSSPYSDCENSTAELERFHWSYLNIGYHPDVLDEWGNQGCLEEVTLRLGYRHQLTTATINTEAKPDGIFEATLTMINSGYANFFNKRDLYLILKNNDTQDEYSLKTDIDPRKWPIGEAHTIQITAGIPESVTEGLYSVYLSLPDENPLLKENPNYAVRLANADSWDPSTGYNDLGADLDISATHSDLTDYVGTAFFNVTNAPSPLSLAGSDLINGSGNANSIVLYWPLQEANFSRVVERSVDGGMFSSYAALDAKTGTFTDVNISTGINYGYRYKIKNDLNEETEYSNILVTAIDESAFSLNTDGNTSDWQGIEPTHGSFGAHFETLKTYFGNQFAHFLAENTTNTLIYLNVDSDTTTGIKISEHAGMDYKVEDSKLYGASGGTWTFLSNLISANQEALEVEIPFDQMPLLGSNASIDLLCVSDDSFLIGSTGAKTTHYRQIPADVPNIVSLENDELNETALVITWDICEFCDGYILERSENTQEDFIVVDEFEKNEISVRDRGLNIGSNYSYRLKAYNELGESNYSETKNLTLDIILGFSDLELKVYPNPTPSHLRLSKSVSNIYAFSMNGKMVLEKQNTRELFVGNLRKGIYMIKITHNHKTYSYRLIKN